MYVCVCVFVWSHLMISKYFITWLCYDPQKGKIMLESKRGIGCGNENEVLCVFASSIEIVSVGIFKADFFFVNFNWKN